MIEKSFNAPLNLSPLIKMHILGEKFISISLALSQKNEIEKWPLRTSVQCTLFIVAPIVREGLCYVLVFMGAQWLSGRVLDSRPKGRGFEPHRRHCVVVLEQDTFILA